MKKLDSIHHHCDPIGSAPRTGWLPAPKNAHCSDAQLMDVLVRRAATSCAADVAESLFNGATPNTWAAEAADLITALVDTGNFRRVETFFSTFIHELNTNELRVGLELTEAHTAFAAIQGAVQQTVQYHHGWFLAQGDITVAISRGAYSTAPDPYRNPAAGTSATEQVQSQRSSHELAAQ